nr:hypothetical protein [uncultured Clostridium sp.]
MLKLQFENAVVEDTGYGLEVNGKRLEDLISVALGTKLGSKRAGYGGDLPTFKSNSCDITVTINPHPQNVTIETENNLWHSVGEMEEEKHNELEKKDAEADPEE